MIKALENFTYYLEGKPLQIYSGHVVSLPDGDEAFLISEGRAEEIQNAASGPEYETIFNDDVTTIISSEPGAPDIPFAYLEVDPEDITGGKIKVTFNDQEYMCELTSQSLYGGSFDPETNEPDYSDYPFIIGHDIRIFLFTEEPGTYSLKIEVPVEEEPVDLSGVMRFLGAGVQYKNSSSITLDAGESTEVELVLRSRVPSYLIPEGSPRDAPPVIGIIQRITIDGALVNYWDAHIEHYYDYNESRWINIALMYMKNITNGSITFGTDNICVEAVFFTYDPKKPDELQAA